MLGVSKKQKEGQSGCGRADGAGLVRAEVRELPRAWVLFKGKGVTGGMAALKSALLALGC